MVRRAALMLLLLAAASVGPARAEGDPACARYEDPLAYNACLASHGPKAKDLATTGAHHGDERPARPAQAAREKPPARIERGSPHVMHAHGRSHMEFLLR